jgi:hypothetical protein
VEREGARRELRVIAADRRGVVAVTPRPPASAGPGSPLRYAGTIGDATIEVRGAPVTVTTLEETGELIIQTGSTWIRVKVPPSRRGGGSD